MYMYVFHAKHCDHILSLLIKMQPRLYMQSFQYATYNRVSGRMTFETRHACGRRFYFSLTKNQFLALNDAIILINEENAYGHYPLGQNTWMHYNASDASLYRDLNNDDNSRVHFIFASFDEYMNYTHRRLLSLVRLKDNKTVAAAIAARARRNGRGRRRNGTSVTTSYKRPLSVAVQPSNRSPASKRPCREKREAVSRATDNADVSYTNEESAIFPEWHYSNTRRRSDSISSLSSAKESVAAAEVDCCELSYAASDSTVTMDSE